MVRALLAQKRRVRILVHHNRPVIDDPNIDFFNVDVCDLNSLYRALAGVDIVYLLASKLSLSTNNRSETEEVNVNGTRDVVEACLKCGVQRLIHFSSIEAMVQEPLNMPLNELQSLVDIQNCSPYARSKAAAEIEVRKGIEQGLDAIILSPTAVIGPNDYQPSYLGEALIALAKKKFPAIIEGGFDWVDVRDVVNGALQAEDKAPLGSKYLLSGHCLSINDLA